MNDTLVGSNSGEEFVLNIAGIHDEKVWINKAYQVVTIQKSI